MLFGAGKAPIPFLEDLLPVENFNDVHDDLYVRVMIFRSDAPFCIFCFDFTSLRPYAIDAFRGRVSELTGISEDNIWACVSHTFSAPHLRSEEALAREGKETEKKNDLLMSGMMSALESAVHRALASQEEIRIGLGHAVCSVNVNRDVFTKKGWWIGSDDLQESDKTVSIIRVDRMDGSPKAVLYSYDVQSSVMDHVKGKDGKSRISGDLAGAACRYIEQTFGDDFVAMFLIGAAGDQAPSYKAIASIVGPEGDLTEKDYGEEGFLLVDVQGAKLGSKVVQTMGNISTANVDSERSSYDRSVIICPGQKIAPDLKSIHPTRTYDFEKDEDRQVEIAIYTLGDIAIAGIAPELSSTTGTDIRKESPYPMTMVVTLVNGGEKYMPESSAYDRITYEAMNSKFARGSAEILKREIIDIMKDKKGV